MQDQKRKDDQVATAVGAVIFWPSLFFIDGANAQTAELARLEGEKQAIEQASIQKNCGIQFQRQAARTDLHRARSIALLAEAWAPAPRRG